MKADNPTPSAYQAKILLDMARGGWIFHFPDRNRAIAACAGCGHLHCVRIGTFRILRRHKWVKKSQTLRAENRRIIAHDFRITGAGREVLVSLTAKEN